MPRTNRRVVVHGGMGKTGSSAIQRWLQAHRAELAAQGIRYPDHSVDVNGVSSGNWPQLLNFADGKFTVDEAAVDATLADFESSGSGVLLLSSEYFGASIPQLWQALPSGTRYILYVRDPVDYLESAYNQMVKRAGTTDVMNPVRSPTDYAGPEFDIAPTGLEPGAGIGYLDGLVASLPETVDIVLRPFHWDLFVGRGILSDLFAAADLPTDGLEFPTYERVNGSYTLPALEFRRTSNHLPMDALGPRLDAALQACDVGVSDYTLIPPEDQAELRAYAVDEMDRLIQKCAQKDLLALRDLVVRGTAKTFLPQVAERRELHDVAVHVGRVDPDLLAGLRALRAEHPAIELPYAGFPDFR